jgi:uncharacterized protein (TIGR00299 family) protein
MAGNKVLLDVATAGASGDMFLSALMDLLGQDDSLLPVAASLLIFDPTLRIRVSNQTSKGRSGKRLDVTLDERVRLTPKSLMDVLETVSEELELSETAKGFAKKALTEVLEAESRAHDTPLDKLHLQELGTVDTILDIVGTAYLLERAELLGKSRFVATKVAVGSGTIETDHGSVEVPVPAVAEILVAHDVPFHNGSAKTEVLTPTGAALLVTLADEFVDSSEGFVAKKQGVGFGTRDLGDVPNAMRIIIGEEAPRVERPAEKPTKRPVEKIPEKAIKKPMERTATTPAKVAEEKTESLDAWMDEDVVVIEATVDDIDGDIASTLYDVLVSEGHAFDVMMIPAFCRKNRPCYIVRAIAAKNQLKNVAEVLIRHVGAPGVRYTTWQRLTAAKETVVCKLELEGKEFTVHVKVSRGLDGSIINIRPDSDDVIRVSRATGIPIMELKPRITLQACEVSE